MKTLVLGAVFGAGVLLLAAAPAYADSNVLCVQQELASRGYDAGLLDGQLGYQTQSAAHRAGLGSVTAANAGSWCASLRGGQARTFSSVTPSYSYVQPGSGYEPPYVRRLAPHTTFNSHSASNCPAYVIDTNDPCF